MKRKIAVGTQNSQPLGYNTPRQKAPGGRRTGGQRESSREWDGPTTPAARGAGPPTSLRLKTPGRSTPPTCTRGSTCHPHTLPSSPAAAPTVAPRRINPACPAARPPACPAARPPDRPRSARLLPSLRPALPVARTRTRLRPPARPQQPAAHAAANGRPRPRAVRLPPPAPPRAKPAGAGYVFGAPPQQLARQRGAPPRGEGRGEGVGAQSSSAA